MDWSLYKACLRSAERQMRLINVNSVGGKEAHDFAIDALRATGYELKRVRLDIIDAIRRELGRGPRRYRNQKTGEMVLRKWSRQRKYQQLHKDIPVPKEDKTDPEWFSDWANILGPRQRLVAIMLSKGVEKKDIATVLGVTPSMVSIICKQIRRAMRKHLEKQGKL